jgi:hypothetical protein
MRTRGVTALEQSVAKQFATGGLNTESNLNKFYKIENHELRYLRKCRLTENRKIVSPQMKVHSQYNLFI